LKKTGIAVEDIKTQEKLIPQSITLQNHLRSSDLKTRIKAELLQLLLEDLRLLKDSQMQ
jgi:hypothetical protein